MWLRTPILVLLLLRAGRGDQDCSGAPNKSCPHQDIQRGRGITEIPKSVSPVVTEMFFIETSIAEIRRGAFENMSNLVNIEFINSKVERVEAGAFDNLEKLRNLEITGAELEDLPVGTFRSLAHLRKVNLRDSHVRRIEKGLFDGLGGLEEAYLHRNEITSLPDGVFDGLPKLSLLHLGWNQISNISPDLFKQLTQLKTLRLQNNQIGSLGEGTLDSLQDLVELNLESNRIQSLPPNLLRQLVNLEKVFLDKNLIEVLPDEIFLGLRNVKQLKMASNHLKALPPLGPMRLLKELDLSRNKISSLENLAAASLPSLTTLKLQGNLLETIPTGHFDPLGKLTALHLGDNPWRCDCHLLYLHQWIHNNAKRIKDTWKIICRSPGDLAGKAVSSLSEDQLLCLTTTAPIVTTFKAAPSPTSASPSATPARGSTAGASARSITLPETSPPSQTSAAAPQTHPAKSTHIMSISRTWSTTAPMSPQPPPPSSSLAVTQSSTSARTTHEMTSTDTPATITEVTAPRDMPTKTPPTALTNISSARFYEQFTVLKRSTESQDPPTHPPVITTSSVCRSRPPAPEPLTRQTLTVPSITAPGATLAHTPVAGSAPALPSAADQPFCPPSSLPPLPRSVGSPLSPSRPALVPQQHWAWGLLLSSDYRYCPVFLLLYLSMLSVSIFCAAVLGRLAYALHKATEPVQLPCRPVRLVHVKARQGRK
ncbi:chondroadherin-like [Crotalus adamanteus]|uniref:Chondroadherin-like n=1 Tax=Crotalus adamanteus TaxID=8729 RepID=A0AAW1BIB3_CROAD